MRKSLIVATRVHVHVVTADHRRRWRSAPVTCSSSSNSSSSRLLLHSTVNTTVGPCSRMVSSFISFQRKEGMEIDFSNADISLMISGPSTGFQTLVRWGGCFQIKKAASLWDGLITGLTTSMNKGRSCPITECYNEISRSSWPCRNIINVVCFHLRLPGSNQQFPPSPTLKPCSADW